MSHVVTNDGDSPMYVGGQMIPPGETKVIEDGDAPPEFRAPAPPVEEEPAKDTLAEIAGFKADLILPLLADLSDEDLARLQGLESEGKARKTVLEGIAAEGLKRAQVKTDPAAE